MQAGKVRHVAASNYSAKRLTEALEVSERLGIARFAALQTHYNLMERADSRRSFRTSLADRGIGALPYYGLAKGFLTGKYRAGEQIDSPRAKGASTYVGERGDRVLAALREVAEEHAAPLPAVALRWLADQPTVIAPIASGRTVEQLADLLPMQDLVLTDDAAAVPHRRVGTERRRERRKLRSRPSSASDRGDAVPDGLDKLRGDVGDAVVGGRVAGDLGEDPVLVGGRETGTAAGDDVSAGEGLHGWTPCRGDGADRSDARPGFGGYSGGVGAADARSSTRSRPTTSPLGSVQSTGSKRCAGSG